jgi:tRNA U34 5-carboxymethylaminomethyl modifying GTPase MnmE/TrmE
VNARFRVATARTAGAVGVIEITGDVDGALAALGVAPVATGRVALRDLAGVDTGLVCRWSDDCCHLTPHGGALIMRRLCEAIGRAGIRSAAQPDLKAAWPEAADLHEARMLEALARVRSPRAVDLLLDQPRRWRAQDSGEAVFDGAAIDAHSRALDRLLAPALVVAIGAPNIGKSTLLNALAGSPVSVVADEPGATRDHVGALVVLDGVAVRWIDTPGLRAGAVGVEREAAAIAREAARGADLLVVCEDAAAPCPTPAELAPVPALRVGLRADLAPAPGAAVQTAAGAGGAGVAELALAVRRRLVPDEALAWPGPWRLPEADDASPDPGKAPN